MNPTFDIQNLSTKQSIKSRSYYSSLENSRLFSSRIRDQSLINALQKIQQRLGSIHKQIRESNRMFPRLQRLAVQTNNKLQGMQKELRSNTLRLQMIQGQIQYNIHTRNSENQQKEQNIPKNSPKDQKKWPDILQQGINNKRRINYFISNSSRKNQQKNEQEPVQILLKKLKKK